MFITAKFRRKAAVIAMACIPTLLITSTASTAHAATVTMSGTVTAGGTPVPKGTVQVAFLQYAAGNTCAYPTALTGKIIVAMVGTNGTFSEQLDMAYPYRVIFRPMTTAPSTALWRLYKEGAADGVTSFSDSTCLNSIGGAKSNINLSTTNQGVKVSGSLSTSTGLPVTTGATIVLSRTPENYLLWGNGYIQKVSDSGSWDLSGIDVNQPNLYMQVNVNNTMYSVKKVGSNYTVIPHDATCGDACKFPIATTDIANMNLTLPVTGLITGTISGPSGPVGLGQVCAIAYRDGGTAMNMYTMEAGRSCTNASGQYSLGLTYGAYRLQFLNNGSAPFKTQWFDGVANTSGYFGATVINLASGANATRTINPTMEEGKFISGTITNSSGQPVKGASVSAMITNSSNGMTVGVGGTQSADDGTYTLAGLEPGKYILMANHPDYGMMYLGGSRENATQFEILANSPGATGKNISFPLGYALSGTISTGDNSEARVCVAAYKQTETAMGWGDFVGSNCYTAPGPWRLKGIRQGQYRIRFDAQTGNLRSIFLGNTTDFNEATILSVSSSDIPNIDLTIPAGKLISGRIVNEENQAVQGACVVAFKQNSEAWGWGQPTSSTCSSTTGEYQLRGLEDGDYKLRLESPMNSDYTPGFFSDSTTPTRSVDNAQIFTLGSSRTGVNQTLKKGPVFTATIKDGSTPVAQTCVSAFKKVDEYGWGEWGGSSCSGTDGAIRIRGLSPGSYTFEVRPNSGNYQNGWYVQGSSTTQTRASATVKAIDADSVSLGNILLSSGKLASGKIVNADGDPIQGACVGSLKDSAFGWGEWSGSACTQKDGKFTIRGLDPASSYRFRVEVWAGDYKPGFITASGGITSDHSSVTPLSAASDIVIGDVTLPTAPSISGTVTSGNNEAEANVCVNAHDSATLMWKSSMCTQSNGKFTLRGLDAGEYKLSWWTPKPTLTNGWYKSVSSGATSVSNPDSAGVLTLPISGLTDISIRLANGSKIFGTISGVQSSEICVAAWTNNSSGPRDNASAISCVNSEMKYELKGLSSSTQYYLQVFRKDSTAITQTSPTTDEAQTTGSGGAVNITVAP